jgi:homoserine dehydrogenase
VLNWNSKFIGQICVQDTTKPRTIDTSNFTFDKHEVLASKEHNLIVELTSDADAALEIITDSLAKGRSVVTAGKKVLAENFELLYRLQQQTGASLLYEAACAGSIPIILTLE